MAEGFLLTFPYFFGISYVISVSIGVGVIIVYAAFGGIRAVTFTDVIQFSVLIVAIPITFSIGVDMVGGVHGIINSVPREKLTLFPEGQDQLRFYSLFFVFILPYMNPALVQRLLMGRSTQQNRRALIISALGRIPYYSMVAILGLVAFILEPTLQPDMAFPYLVNQILPVGIKGLVIAGVLAVIMSTADSFLHVTGLLLTHDVIRPITGLKTNSKKELVVTRIVTVVIGVMVQLRSLRKQDQDELEQS